MKSYEEIRESTSNEIKKDCLAYVGDEEGQSRVNKIIEYFRHCTLHPQVTRTYTQALLDYKPDMLDAPKADVEKWNDFSDFLIKRLIPRASENFIP